MMTLKELDKQFHLNAYNFSQSLADHEKGQFGLFDVFDFRGTARPDYSRCHGLFPTRGKAEKKRWSMLRLGHSYCLIVVQV